MVEHSQYNINKTMKKMMIRLKQPISLFAVSRPSPENIDQMMDKILFTVNKKILEVNIA